MNFVGSRFSGRAHYNEFLESRSKSWALMGRRLVLGVKNALHQTALCPKEKGSLTQECELPTPLASQEPLSFLWAFWPPSLSPALGDLCCYILLSSIHPPPTLFSHSCPYSSARPIGHSFWHSVSCCGLHRTVQGSHPHQWDQGVSCEYLIRRWQFHLGLLFYHAPRRAWNLFWDPQEDCLRRRGAFLSYDFGLPRIGSFSAVHSCNLDSLHSSSGTSSSSAWALGLKWNGPKPLEPFGPTIAPQNHAARLLGRGGGFWCSRAYIMAGWVLFPYGCQGSFIYP